MTSDEKSPSREELAEDVAARMRAAGLDAVSDGENVTVREPAKAADPDGASAGKNIATVLGAALASAALALLLSFLWFGVAFSILLGGEASDASHRAGAIGFTMAALFGGLAAFFAGFGARTPTGERDTVALVLGILLGTPVLYAMLRSLGNTIDTLNAFPDTLVQVVASYFGAYGLARTVSAVICGVFLAWVFHKKLLPRVRAQAPATAVPNPPSPPPRAA